MKVRVHPDVARSFPELRIGVVSFDAIARNAADDAVSAALAEAEIEARAAASDAEAVKALPMVDAWREVYRRFGANPNRTRPSSEALLRRVAKGDALPRINALVDLYNAATLKWHLPIGGYDLTNVVGDVVLRTSPGGEPFVGIGGSTSEPTSPGEIVYADDARVLTRSWNYRDADATKVTPESRRVTLFVEAPLASMETSRLEAILGFLETRGAEALGCAARRGLLTVAESPELEL